jgi:phage shock protein PspC (stress-responsive transcriptional regulator)
MNCKDAVASLVASLESGTPLNEIARAHLAACERCAPLLDSAREFQASLDGDSGAEPAVGPATSRAEEEVRRARHRRFAVRVVVGLVIAFALLALGSVAAGHGGQGAVEMMIVGGAVVLGTIPIVIVLALARAIARPSHGRPLYKRLGPGRMLDGVALGLSEATKVNVSVIRLLFFGLLFFDGVGLVLYLLLALFMPVHPDDRQFLLRFRLRRWLRRTAAAPDAR